ncbi:unnamed protein product [Pleuronectes platessa]|uniref:Uncharacterized protein n=1 Tax=Pleuronectes platessa TaxID=8262 RepID=A0A9N7V1P0_PLEPL|nr:unnamed protein product [Pleuronectes platessa]
MAQALACPRCQQAPSALSARLPPEREEEIESQIESLLITYSPGLQLSRKEPGDNKYTRVEKMLDIEKGDTGLGKPLTWWVLLELGSLLDFLKQMWHFPLRGGFGDLTMSSLPLGACESSSSSFLPQSAVDLCSFRIIFNPVVFLSEMGSGRTREPTLSGNAYISTQREKNTPKE